MHRQERLSFKLLVPPRMSIGHVTDVRAKELPVSCGEPNDAPLKIPSKYFDKEDSNAVMSPIKPTSQDFSELKVSPLEKDENDCSSVQLYSKLCDEVEKIKCWKIKVDSEAEQKERKLQENRKTIESQRKAILELQFENESLSIKLEQQIGENEDLRNKNNSTQNMCNMLKDTVQQSVDKMHLFESEREETHQFLVANNQSIQKMIAAFETLRIQAEADQQEMQKTKECLLQFQVLKDKYNQEYNIKEKEIAMLQRKLEAKENEFQKVLHDLREAQNRYRQLQEEIKKQYEAAKVSKAAQDSLLHKLQSAEQHAKEFEKKWAAIATELKERKEEYEQIIQSRDVSLQELRNVKNQQAEKLEQNHTTIQELQNSLALETQRAKQYEDELKEKSEQLEERNALLGETTEQSAEKDGQIRILEDELDTRARSMESMTSKMDALEVRVEELKVELSRRTEEAQVFMSEAQTTLAERDQLQKACEDAEKAEADLKEKYNTAEIRVQELEGQLFDETKKTEECASEMKQLKQELSQHKVKYEELLSNFDEVESERKAIEEQLESRSSNVKAIEANMKVSEEKAAELTREVQRLNEENQQLRDEASSFNTKIQERCEEAEALQRKMEENCEHLLGKITKKESQIRAMETKLCSLRKKIGTKLKAQEECQRENKKLKKQMAKEIVKSNQLENVINSLHEESQNLQRLNEGNCQKLLTDLESKSSLAAELENEVQQLRRAAAEAVKSKEDAELKCQQKTADMVALMEKHKSQYDRMVEEKDAELEEKRKKEREAVTHMKALELDFSNMKKGNDQLKEQLTAAEADKENLQRESDDLRKEISSLKLTQLSGAKNNQPSAFEHKQGKRSETAKYSSSKTRVYEFSKTSKTHSSSQDDGKTAAVNKAVTVEGSDTESIRTGYGRTPKTKKIYKEELTTPKSASNSYHGTSKIKTYRMKTPPSDKKRECWGKRELVFEPKSDSSEQNDLLTFANLPDTIFPAPNPRPNVLKKIQSPLTHKSPGNSLKVAAMKRMRDAGWTAVTKCDKKMKKTKENIFA